MSKKKKRKEPGKKDVSYKTELIGFLLIIVAIIGFVPHTGVAGSFIKSFSVFLVGTWYSLFLIALIVIGIYMMVKREKPEFLTAKLVGLYILILGILVSSHVQYISNSDLKGIEIIRETVNNFMLSSGNSRANLGGGIIGACFSSLFVFLFDIRGTNVVIVALIVCGFVMFTGLSITDLIKLLFEKTKQMKPHKQEKEVVQPIAEEKEENIEERVIVSSVDELLKIKAEPKEEKQEETPTVDLEVAPKRFTYHLPSLKLLNDMNKNKGGEPKEVIQHNVETLERVISDFGISAKVVAINSGPTITQYEMEIKAGTKVSKIASLNKEIALAMAAKDIRIQAPIPGKSTIGVEIPNRKPSMVSVKEILTKFEKDKRKLLVALGKDIMGRPQYCEINKTPHLLVAGSTGSGKSVCINSIIVSILMRARPEEVKLVLVDPKMVELSMYNGVPHLLAPVVTDSRKANIALKKIVVEMERRYEIFRDSGTKNIEGYNQYVEKENVNRSKDNKIQKLPFIVVIIDELADLMLVAAKEVEDSIMRITQMARAAGIHLIVATQRPSTDVITGVVKANIPSRISFAVSSQIDSRTILDMPGAEKLIGKGDMLYRPQDENIPIRIQGTFISDDEIKKVVDYTISQQKAKYDETLLMDSEEMKATSMVEDAKDATEEPLYDEIVDFVVQNGKASTSLIQRRFRLGYNRAARCIDLLEERGIVGPSNGSKPREVLIKKEAEE